MSIVKLFHGHYLCPCITARTGVLNFTQTDSKPFVQGKYSSRHSGDLRAMLSSKERREESRDRDRGRRERRDRSRRHSGSDLRDRLTDKYKDSDSYHRDQHCELSSSGKKQLLSMFLEDNKNPDKDFKGKENGDIESLLETNRKQQKDLEKRLDSGSERKKKKKRRSKSRSKDRKPLVSKDTENRKRKLSSSTSDKDKEDESRPKKDKARSRTRDKDSKKKKKDKKSRNRSASEERPRSPSKTSSGSRKSRVDSGIGTDKSISPRDDRVPSPVKEVKQEVQSSPKKENIQSPKKSPQKEECKGGEDLDDSKKTPFSSPSPPRKVVELPAEENDHKEAAKDDPENPYSIYEQKHGVKLESKVESKEHKEPRRRSRSRERRRSRSRDPRRTRSRDRGHRRSRERDLKDEIEEDRRRRRREYYQDRERYARREREHHRHSGRHSPPGGRRRRRSGGDPASWEDKVNSFLANTLNATASGVPGGSLVEITKSEILPTDFDPSKPPPGMILPDYAIPASELVSGEAEVETMVEVGASGQPIRMLTDVQTGQLIPQPGGAKLVGPVTPEASSYVTPPPLTSLPPPDYQQTMDITITAQPQAPAVNLEAEIAALNAMNQEREKNKKDDRPLTVKEKKKLEKGRKMIWQYVSKKLLSDPVFCDKVKKKKAKGTEDLKEKAEKCAVRIGLKLEKSGFSETRLWLMLKDNEKGIVGFHDELSAAVINETIETDLDARKPKDRLDAELLKDGTVFKYIGQYIQANPTLGKHDAMPSSGDLQEILETVNSNSSSPEPPVEAPEVESEWDLAIKSFAPFKVYLTAQRVPAEVVEAYILCLVLSAFTYPDLQQCVTNFQPPEPEDPDEPPETVYGHLLNCLREISFEKYPRVITENIDGHTVSIVRFVLDHYSKPRSPSPAPQTSKTTSPVPPVSPTEDALVPPTGANTSSQLPRKKYVLVSVSVDTIPVETGLAVWQVRSLYTNTHPPKNLAFPVL